jgi:hypothetical protein
VIVYNSSIGLEAALMGKAVICGGRARYTQLPIVCFPHSQAEYLDNVQAFLRASSEEEILASYIPPDFQRNSRRFLYFQLYCASLPMGAYLQEGAKMGFVQFKPFDWQSLQAVKNPTIGIIKDGILEGKPFLVVETSDDRF